MGTACRAPSESWSKDERFSSILTDPLTLSGVEGWFDGLTISDIKLRSLTDCIICNKKYSIIKDTLSPTIHREKGYRFHFFSREESRAHVHVICASGEAKYWLLPEVELARNQNLNGVQLKEIESIIEVNCNEFRNAWKTYFES